MTKVAGTKISNTETNLDGFKKTDLSAYAKDNEFGLLKGSVNIIGSTVNDIEKDYLKKSSLDAYAKKTEVASDITSLITKADFDAKLKDISDRVTNNKSKDLLLDNELKK